MSAVEATVSLIAGYLMNVAIQFLVYPVFGIDVPIESAFVISLFITGVAFLKNYGVRRLFNYIHIRSSSTVL